LDWCSTPNMVTVKKIYDNNAEHAFIQCTSCGFKKGPISKKDIDLASLPLFDEELNSNLNDKIYEEYNRVQAELSELKKKTFFIKYNEYLNSEIWKNKRDRVLERDNNLCQACLRNTAIEVHHTTYKHVFDEPLFELVSVCKNCHDKITKLDNQKNELFSGD